MKKTKLYIYFYILILLVIASASIIFLNNFNDILDHVPPIVKQVISFSLIALLLLYFQIIKNFLRERDISHKEILKYLIITAVISTIIHPTISSDIFYYVSYGIVQGKYNLNPYLTTIENVRKSFADPPFYALENVALIASMTYGYIYTLYLKLLYIISFNNYFIMFYTIKLFNIAAVWALISVIIKIKEHLRKDFDNRLIYLLIGLNPLVILEFLSNGHNDIIFALLVSLGVYMLIKERYILSGIILICSFNIKSSAIFILPFVYLYCIKKKISLKIKLSYLFLFVLSLYPYYFFYGLSTIPKGLAVYSKFIDIGFPVALLNIIMGREENIVNNFYIYNNVTAIVKYAWICFYSGLLMLYFIRKKNNSIERVMKYIFISFALYLLIFSSVMFPWYSIWLLPFVLYFECLKFIRVNFVFAGFDILYQVIVMQNFGFKWNPILIYLFVVVYVVYFLYTAYINRKGAALTT